MDKSTKQSIIKKQSVYRNELPLIPAELRHPIPFLAASAAKDAEGNCTHTAARLPRIPARFPLSPPPRSLSGSGGNWPPVNCLQISWNETVKKPFPLPEKAMKCTDTTFLLLCTLFPSPEIMEQFFGRSPDSWFIRRSAFSAFRPMAYAPLSPNTVKAAVRDSHPLPFSSAGRTPRSPKTLYGISVISVFFGYSVTAAGEVKQQKPCGAPL